MKKTILLTIILLALALNIFSQDGTAMATDNRVANEGKIDGTIPKYNIRVNKLSYLSKMARPTLFLAFSENRSYKFESSKNIRKILDSHWKEAIEHYYANHLNKAANAQETNDNSLKWALQSNKNISKLQKISIEPLGVERKISEIEASDMIGFLNKIAISIMDMAKEVKGEYQEIKIKSKPRTSIGNCRQSRGTVKLDVTFDKSAKVTEIKVKQASGCEEFDQRAIEASIGIEFEPARSDGEAITVIKTVVYSFRRY